MQVLARSLLVLPLFSLSGDEPVAEAQEALQSRDAAERESAVRRLARLDTERAWELVAGALADPAGSVAETAELELGKARSTLALAALLGRSGLAAREESVAARAAEALGRSPHPLPAEPLLEAIERDDERRALALWAIESAARGGRWPEVDESFQRVARLARGSPRHGRDGAAERVAARALACALALDRARGAELLRKCLADGGGGLRAAACTLAAEHLEPEAAEGLAVELLDDDDWRARSAALDVVAALGAPASLARLLERLTREPRPRLRARLLERLQARSGRRHGADPRPWQAWIESLGEDRARASGAAADADPHAREQTVSLERVEVRSDHVAFLVDFSGSMWMGRAEGPARKELVDVRLAELLERLDQKTRFLLIPFTQVPHPWQAELVSATRGNVAKAASFFEQCRERGSGDFWEAALLALADDAVDTLVVLTDGVPTGGAYNRMELLARLFAERNLSRRVTLDALLIDPSPASLASWSRLCAGTGGRCTPVRLSTDG